MSLSRIVDFVKEFSYHLALLYTLLYWVACGVNIQGVDQDQANKATMWPVAWSQQHLNVLTDTRFAFFLMWEKMLNRV